jgi:hypothetical protein
MGTNVSTAYTRALKAVRRTRVRIGFGGDRLVVSGCNDLVLVVCRLENSYPAPKQSK